MTNRFRQTARVCALQHRARGSVLVLCLLLASVGSAGLLFLFDIGQTVGAKSRLVDAADSAAWSAATWRARVLNYTAYSNRAIIAQEVAVAQAITLESWARYFETFAESIDELASVYPPARAVTYYVAQGAYYSRIATQWAAFAETMARDMPYLGYKTLLAQSQRVMHYSAGTFGAAAVANEVAKTTDQRFFAFALPDAQAWNRFARRYESDDDRQRLKALVMRSLDEFTRGPRDGDLIIKALGACIGLGYRKRGGTTMSPDLERWEAADTGSLHAPSLSGLFGGCGSQEIYKMGWGAAQVSAVGQRNEILADPGGVSLNPKALNEAEQALGDTDRPTHFGTGIARVFDLDYERLQNKSFPTSRIAVLARLPWRDIRLARTVPAGLDRLAGQSPAAEQSVRALAAAEVYFRRPPGPDTRLEYASLYNPYWQVRLVAPNAVERALADAY